MCPILRQGVNRHWGFVAQHSFPIIKQLLAVGHSPLQDQAENPGRQAALKCRQRVDVDGDLLTSVTGVEVRGVVFAASLPMHRDHDAEESADSGHGSTP